MRKKCSKCGEEKPLDLENFYWRKDSNKWRNECRVCYKKLRKQYSQDNKELIKQLQKQWRQDNKEQIKQWRQDNKEQINAYNRKRRAKRKAVNENYTSQDEAYTRQLFGHMCFNCQTTENLTVDHHYPLSKGHALTRDNAVLLCQPCNSSKHNKMPEEFYTELQCYQLDYMLSF